MWIKKKKISGVCPLRCAQCGNADLPRVRLGVFCVAVMDYFMWLTYGYLIPSWTLATLSVFYTILIFAIKTAQERKAAAPERAVKTI